MAFEFGECPSKFKERLQNLKYHGDFTEENLWDLYKDVILDLSDCDPAINECDEKTRAITARLKLKHS